MAGWLISELEHASWGSPSRGQTRPTDVAADLVHNAVGVVHEEGAGQDASGELEPHVPFVRDARLQGDVGLRRARALVAA